MPVKQFGRIAFETSRVIALQVHEGGTATVYLDAGQGAEKPLTFLLSKEESANYLTYVKGATAPVGP